ncbi:MAG: chemotaxis protein CheC [Deltaproteobacteria bacterium]|nr:chemotaxis protein CheC [Deltaproteobacteria bacterium]
MSPREADHDLLEAGAREAAEAILRLARQESARLVAAGREPVGNVMVRVGPRAVIIGFTVSGGVGGPFAIAMSEDAGRTLAAAMMGRTAPAGEKLGKRAVAALAELGNIAASAFMNGAAELLHQSCLPSVPSLAVGDPAELLPKALSGRSQAQVARVEVGGVQVELLLA